MTTLVAIRSVAFPNHYVRLEAQGVASFTMPGGGAVKIQSYIGFNETFILQHNDDKTVSFKSTVFDNVFIRMEGYEVPKDMKVAEGYGLVNAQFSAGSLERFHIQKKGSAQGQNQGVVGIESALMQGDF